MGWSAGFPNRDDIVGWARDKAMAEDRPISDVIREALFLLREKIESGAKSE